MEALKRKLTVPAFTASLKAFRQPFQAVDVHSAQSNFHINRNNPRLQNQIWQRTFKVESVIASQWTYMSGEVSGVSVSAASRIFKAFQTCQKRPSESTITMHNILEELPEHQYTLSQVQESRFFSCTIFELILCLQSQVCLTLQLFISFHPVLGRHDCMWAHQRLHT